MQPIGHRLSLRPQTLTFTSLEVYFISSAIQILSIFTATNSFIFVLFFCVFCAGNLVSHGNPLEMFAVEKTCGSGYERRSCFAVFKSNS